MGTHNTWINRTEIRSETSDRLYVVMAECRTHRVGEEAWAGIGWVQDEVSGKGLFVEHEGPSEAFVRGAIDASLESLVAGAALVRAQA